jgi:hypothetical protein
MSIVVEFLMENKSQGESGRRLLMKKENKGELEE